MKLSDVRRKTISETDNEAYFNSLYADNHRVVYAYLLGRTGCVADAEELLQEVFVRVWRNLADVRAVPCDRRRFWLFRIAKNLILDWNRRKTVRESYLRGLASTEESGSAISDPATVLELCDTADAVDNAIARLPDDLRTVLVLHVMAELKSAEVGRLLGRPAGTIRYQLAEARRRVAEEMKRLELR